MAQRKFPQWATDDIADIGNGDPNKADPGAAKQASGWAVEKPLLQTFNWLQNLFGHFVSANNQFREKSTGVETEAGEIVLADNLTSVVNILLPASPLSGQWVIVGGLAKFSDFGVTVDGNGNDIMVTGDSSVNLDINNTLFLFYWDDTNSIWKINIWGTQGEVL